MGKREDVLEAAAGRFYAAGIANTGVDAVAEVAGVSKRTLYNHFGSKQELVTAVMELQETRWRDRLATALAGLEEPSDRLDAYVRAYVTPSSSRWTRGCVMLNAAAELEDDAPALAVILASKQRVVDDVTDLLVRIGTSDPAPTARAVATIMEGGCSLTGVQRAPVDPEPLVAAVRTLAGSRAPAPA